LKIIEDGRAPNPRRVRMFLAEKGIDIEYEQIDIMKGEQFAAGFSAGNPLHRVPVLVLDDGTVLSETIAICRYFEEIQPDPALFGRTPLERAVVEMWQRRMELNLLLAVAQCFRHLHPAMAELEVPQVPAWGEANRPRAIALLELLDRELDNRPYIAGENFSVADITALVAIDFMKPARIERPDGLANLERWHQSVSARPSASA